MKAISCAIVFAACILAFWLIAEEEVRKGRDLILASLVFGFMALVAFIEWWSEVRQP